MPKIDMGRAWDQMAKDDSLYHFPRGGDEVEIADWLSEARVRVEAYTTDFFASQRFSPAGRRVLEIGCGAGRQTSWLARMFADVLAVDVSKDLLTTAQAFNTAATNVRWLHVNGEDFHEIQDSTVDFAYSSDVFKHIPSKAIVRGLLAETRRALKPGGLFRIDLACYTSSFVKVAGVPVLPRSLLRATPSWLRYSLHRLRCLVNRQPFQPMSIHPATIGVRFRRSELPGLIRSAGLELLSVEPDRVAPGASWKVWCMGRRPAQ
ncbi:MAG: methyltransferase domain-containing protein [SAR202 cluster bacterium]|nr:methyltransferase domain-containing protein [SAR202 cluster bacterium]